VGRGWLSPPKEPHPFPALGPSGLASSTPTPKLVPTPLPLDSNNSPTSKYYKQYANILTGHCRHEMFFCPAARFSVRLLLTVNPWWSWRRHAVHTALRLHQQLLMQTKQLLSRSIRSLEYMKQILVVVSETLIRCFVNSMLCAERDIWNNRSTRPVIII